MQCSLFLREFRISHPLGNKEPFKFSELNSVLELARKSRARYHARRSRDYALAGYGSCDGKTRASVRT
jgi:hypothetical protein